MTRFGGVLALLSALAGPAAAASPDPAELAVPPGDLSRARALVVRLGSAAYPEREAAQLDLDKMGRLALPALAEGLKAHPSAEVRFRCQALLPKAAAADRQARLDAFLADAGGKFDHDLPGWNEFRTATAGTPAARAVFVELLADPANRALVLGTAGPAGDLGPAVAARKQELYQWRFPRTPTATRREATVADVVALLFAEARVPAKFVPRGVSTSVLFSAPGITAAVADPGEKGRVYKAVVVHWLDTRDDAVSMYQAINVASNLNLKEAGGVAARLVRLKGATPFYRGQAAMTLVRLGGKEHLPALEGLLADETVLLAIAQPGKAERVEIQLRDVALAAALLLTGQEPEAYGFAQRYKDSGGAVRYSYSNWHVAADERAAAFEAWKAWRGKHPDFETAKPEK